MGTESAVRAAIYVRISRDRRRGSLEEGIGVREQEEQCRALADRFGYEVTKVFSDNDISAYSGQPRPRYSKLLEYIAEGKADVVLCWHTDRLHRSNIELEEYINLVEPRDIKTETVTAGIIDLNTPIGRMVARQLCTIARYESEHRSERVRMAHLRLAREGKNRGGRRPFGFEPDTVTVNPAEAALIVQMGKAVQAGVPLREIARDLRSQGIRTSRGTDWRAHGVREVLLRPRNAGLLVHRGLPRKGPLYSDDEIIGKAPWSPIIPESEWRAIVSKLTDPERRTTSGTGRAAKYLGSGIYKCCCGSTLRVDKSSRRAGRFVYRCQERGKGHVTVSLADLDDFVGRVVVERLKRRDAADLIQSPSSDIDVAALQSELAEHRRKLEEIAADYDDDLITKSQMVVRTRRRRTKMDRIKDQLAEVDDGESPLGKVIQADDAKAAWEELTLGEKRIGLKSIFSITVLPVGKGSRSKIEDRVQIGPAEKVRQTV